MIELLTNAEMGEADRLAIAGGGAGIDLMEQAGKAVAAAVVARRPRREPGRGRGRAPATMAAMASWLRVFWPSAAIACGCMLVGDIGRLKGDAALRRDVSADRSKRHSAGELRDAADVVIDALFGAGLDRPVEGLPRAMIEAMNAQSAPIVAVDLPSGINGTSGAVMGVAVRAAQTITFFRRKPDICFCRGGFIAVRPLSPISASPTPSGRGSVPRCSRMFPRSGGTNSRRRKASAINTTAAMRSSCQVRPGRPARRGSRREARCARERAL